MPPTSKSPSLAGTRFRTGSDEAKLWLLLKDQRRHDRKGMLAKLGSKNAEARLKWFKQHGQFPRQGQDYRWITHDDGRLLCIEITKITNI